MTLDNGSNEFLDRKDVFSGGGISREKLKEWLHATDRRYLVFDAITLVNSLSWPDGIDALMQMIASYRNQRMTLDSGRTQKVATPNGGTAVVPVMRGEVLDVDELDRVIRWLMRQIQEQDPTWRIENPPL